MKKTNLLGYTNRSCEDRRLLSTKNRFESQSDDYRSFGFDYFDNPAGMGYGGYSYDGRYEAEVRGIVEYYDLKPMDRILEIGCAKGFVLVEFLKQGFEVVGIDQSRYCHNTCHELLRGRVHCGKAVEFDFPEHYFNLVICKDMLPHVGRDEAARTVAMINKWGKNALLVIQCVSDRKYVENFIYWDSSHKLALTEEGWENFLCDCGYKGEYNLKPII